jgi:S-DNA-T family DNA segregation ATPase FtsK/SpoIIIE
MAKSSKHNEAPQPTFGPVKRLAWMVGAAAWLFITTALIGYVPTDWPSHAVAPQAWPVANWCGPAGAWIAYQLYFTLGPGLWLMMAGWLVALAATGSGRGLPQLPIRIVGALVCAIALSGFVAMQLPDAGAMPEGSGGLIAIWLSDLLQSHFSNVGTTVILLAMFGVGLVVAADELVAAAPNAAARALRKLGTINVPRPQLAGMIGRLRQPATGTVLRPKAVHRRHEIEDPDEEIIEEEPDVEEELIDEEPDAEAVVDEDEDEKYEYEADEEYEEEEEDDEADAEAEQEPVIDADKPVDPEALREKIKKLPITFAKPVAKEEPVDQPQDLSGYKFPSMDVLAEPEHNFNDEIAGHVREQAEILETALQTYKIDAEVVAIDAGPVITLYEVALAPGTKVSQLGTIASDVARELKAQDIRIVPNTAGKSTVGIEVPNIKKERVRLKDLMVLGGSDARDRMRLPMYLGKDASGNPLLADLATMPHMLIAGTTGSGKSVCLNSILMSWLFTRRPDEVKLILVDPKMVEMSMFKDVPHLMCPVITEMGKAAAILEWAVTKMDERYELLAEAGVRDIDSYNELSLKELYEIFDPQNEAEEAKIPKKLYRIVFIIDELADLMMTNKEVESHIVRIAQKARAVGIHLILATQRPQANVVTGLIKSNMPCRVAFKVASGMDSRIVLDSKGAELLLGHGDMLYLSPRSSKLARAQGTLVDDSEIRKTVRFLKEVAAPSFEPQLIQIRSAEHRDVDEEAASDPLFEEAVRVVLETQRGSVSLLQRRLTIGYSRSSRLIEAMAAAGILGSHKGSQAREVTMTLDEWEAMKEQMQADAAVTVHGTVDEEEAGAADVAELEYEDDPDAEYEEVEYEYEEVDEDEEEEDET